ncbi:hypothetical protein JL721_7656 [Aureococcus anophagefferens]|nr:hypothetical protein JL721_7656 [Aureococcus anophagefferens]
MGDREAFAEDGDDAPAVVRSPSPLIIYPGAAASARTGGATVGESNESRGASSGRPSRGRPGTALGRSLSASRLGELVSPAAERRSPAAAKNAFGFGAPRRESGGVAFTSRRPSLRRPRSDRSSLDAATSKQLSSALLRTDSARTPRRSSSPVDGVELSDPPPPSGLDHLWDPVALGRHQRLHKLSDDAKAKANDVDAMYWDDDDVQVTPLASVRKMALFRRQSWSEKVATGYTYRRQESIDRLARKTKGWYIVLPTSAFKVAWDVARDAAYFRFDVFVFVWYACDMALSFVTAYEDAATRSLVVDPAKVRWHYVRTYFLVDLVATVPIELLIRTTVNSDAVKFLPLARAVRYLRVFKMLKLLRVVHLEVAMRRVMKQMRIYPGVDRIAELAVVSLVLAHLVACFWGLLGLRGGDGVDDDACYAGAAVPFRRCSWLQIAGLNREGDGDDNFDLYVTCLYWAITTISTVGFGDIHPNSPGEKIFTSVIMVAGVGMYAIIISSFGAVIASFDTKKREMHSKSEALQRFVHKHDVPMRLATAMHNHQKRYLNAVHLWRTDETEQLVANLPRDLRSALVIHLERSLVSRVPFFIGKPRSFVADAVAVLGPLLADSGEVLVGKGEVANAVYFLVHGAIAIHASGRRGARELGHFRVGAYFGEEGCLLGAHWRAQLSADGACEAQLIEAANLEMLLNHYVTVRDEVYATAALRVRQSALLGVDGGARRASGPASSSRRRGPGARAGPGYATTPHRRPTTRVRAGVSNVRGAATPPQVQFPMALTNRRK